MIYFARCGRWIKIGFSDNGAKQRIDSFRTGNPEPSVQSDDLVKKYPDEFWGV